MAEGDVTRIRYYEIIGAKFRAVYGRRFEESVEPGTHMQRIASAVRDKSLPGDDGEALLDALQPGANLLDIHVASNEVCAFVFYLNAKVGTEQRLLFAPPSPFVKLPLNSSTGEEFITEFQAYGEEEDKGRWASFVCDLGKVRSSLLAERLRPLAAEHSHGKPLELKIPFWFNFVDPKLEASPWVAGDDDEHDEHRLGFFIHGGVHPKTGASLAVQL